MLPTRDEPRWIQDETRFKQALEAAGYQVKILFSQGDSSREQAKGESLITKGIKVLIITPHDGTAAAASANAARAAGVKVISYDRLIRETEAVDYYVTFDLISHKLKEVIAISDTVTVLRDGQTICTLDAHKGEVSEPVLIKHMVGREIENIYPPRELKPPGEVVLDLP